jgi:hypothetical protein
MTVMETANAKMEIVIAAQDLWELIAAFNYARMSVLLEDHVSKENVSV